MKKIKLTKSGKILFLIVLTGITLTGIAHTEDEGKANAEQGAANEAASDREKVEFFEKLYKVKIHGVKPLEEYQDPDSFYAAIAEQVGIPQKAFDAVKKKYGWKQNEEFFLAAMVKGGPDGDDWGVMVTRFPAALKEAKAKDEKMKLLAGMEMRMVVIGYDGAVSFPQESDAAEQDRADQSAASPKSKSVDDEREEKSGSKPETSPEQTTLEKADLDESKEANPSQTVSGPLEVFYTVQTSPSSTAGTGSKPMKASAIHFFDTYIVVEVPKSGGRLFPSDKIIDFKWRGGGRMEPTKEPEVKE